MYVTWRRRDHDDSLESAVCTYCVAGVAKETKPINNFWAVPYAPKIKLCSINN